ncbi:MAG TPA: VOC family protein, partial [Candidatus Binataceae bacterium]
MGSRTGVHHVGLATLDIDKTVEFYTTKLGWEVGWADIIEPAEGGKIKHVFLDTGDGSFVAFMSPEKVPGLPTEFATDINSAQNLPSAFY